MDGAWGTQGRGEKLFWLKNMNGSNDLGWHWGIIEKNTKKKLKQSVCVCVRDNIESVLVNLNYHQWDVLLIGNWNMYHAKGRAIIELMREHRYFTESCAIKILGFLYQLHIYLNQPSFS